MIDRKLKDWIVLYFEKCRLLKKVPKDYELIDFIDKKLEKNGSY
jgi:hypothetical protein